MAINSLTRVMTLAIFVFPFVILSQNSCAKLYHPKQDPQYLRDLINDDKRRDAPLNGYLTNGPKDVSVQSLTLVEGEIYVVTSDKLLWKGASLGQSWHLIDTEGLEPREIASTLRHIFLIAYGPTGPPHIYRKPLTGDTWQRAPGLEDIDCFHVVADETAAYAACGSGIKVFRESTGTWETLGRADYPPNVAFMVLTDSSIFLETEKPSPYFGGRIGTMIVISRDNGALTNARAGLSDETPSVGKVQQANLSDLPKTYYRADLADPSLHLKPYEFSATLTSLIRRRDRIVIGTTRGIFMSALGNENFETIRAPIASLPITRVTSVIGILVAQTSWRLFESSELVQAWVSLVIDSIDTPAIVRRGNQIVAKVTREVDGKARTYLLSSDDGKHWSPLEVGDSIAGNYSICGTGERLYAFTGEQVYVSASTSGTFQKWDVKEPVLAGLFVSSQWTCAANAVVVASQYKSYRVIEGRASWEKIPNRDETTFKLLRAFGGRMYAVDNSNNLYVLEDISGGEWRKLASSGVKGGEIHQTN